MDDRGFAPKLNSVEDMANYMLETQGAKKIGKLWTHHFVKRCSELKMCFNCIYDFQRAFCEDLELIEEWFRLVSNIRSKTIQLGNREWATAIIYNNEEGETILSFLVVQGQYHLSNWYTEIKARITHHQSSSPTPIFETVQALVKGTKRLVYEITFLNVENRILRRANEVLNKHRHIKKIQLHNGGVLTGQEAEDILSQQEVDNQIQRDERQNEGNSNRESFTSRYCRKVLIIQKINDIILQKKMNIWIKYNKQ
ncbi:hypothetical protein SS1G_14120 [Sclerotinia sclerotiorum 1980 UF-70]|uniref:HTH CENPB-type domain-containing protein n=1 Tax=Sclerotinia sclerotiorum (strain ATCC 18683 / 1980 / Ss-1) TaxID=665079 RepID=A7F939_SCLS1|nr:hypothetical protein SS1G_14120 [Sclerotinia sclerotiorum 1980 UF-70]EDO00250.1 hypothetical protein SS1G_14120 [Sclerotinia sclerotiorum 1980 UF-70]